MSAHLVHHLRQAEADISLARGSVGRALLMLQKSGSPVSFGLAILESQLTAVESLTSTVRREIESLKETPLGSIDHG